MLSSISTVFVRPSGAVTVIIPSLTLYWPDTWLPSVSWKLIFSLMLRIYGCRPGSAIRWHSEPVDDICMWCVAAIARGWRASLRSSKRDSIFRWP